ARARAFRTIALDTERPGELAVRIIRAADEGTETPELQSQPAGAADRTHTRVLAGAGIGKEMLAEGLVERVDDVADLEVLGAANCDREIAPEILEHLLPGDPPAGDVVELVLEIGGEIVFDITLEELRQERRDKAAAVLGDEALLVEPHVIAVLQHLDDRGVSRWPADAELLELLNEARFGVARRRLSEMLFRLDLAALERVALLKRRQAPVFLVVLDVVDILAVEGEIAVEGDGRARRAQHDVAG